MLWPAGTSLRSACPRQGVDDEVKEIHVSDPREIPD